jgi:hypothetical protein
VTTQYHGCDDRSDGVPVNDREGCATQEIGRLVLVALLRRQGVAQMVLPEVVGPVLALADNESRRVALESPWVGLGKLTRPVAFLLRPDGEGLLVDGPFSIGAVPGVAEVLSISVEGGSGATSHARRGILW